MLRRLFEADKKLHDEVNAAKKNLNLCKWQFRQTQAKMPFLKMCTFLKDNSKNLEKLRLKRKVQSFSALKMNFKTPF